MPQASETKKGTVDPDEIRHFARDSAHWWDSKGPFAPLHRLNPARMTYIKKQICAHYGLDFQDLKPFENLDILDIGCGGGLVCEPLARLGASVTGIDADENAVAAARTHAKQSGLAITYINGDAAGLNQKFDVVLALEIIEHVTDITAFVGQIAARVKPGGLVIFSTLNRTARSYALGIVAAEYILRWVPRGAYVEEICEAFRVGRACPPCASRPARRYGLDL